MEKCCSDLGDIQVEMSVTQGEIEEEGKGCRRIFPQGGSDVVIYEKYVFGQVPFLPRVPITLGIS